MSVVFYSTENCDINNRLQVRIRQCISNRDTEIELFKMSIQEPIKSYVPTGDLLGPLNNVQMTYDNKLLIPTAVPADKPLIDLEVPIDMNIQEVQQQVKEVPSPKAELTYPTDDIIVTQGVVPDEYTMALPSKDSTTNPKEEFYTPKELAQSPDLFYSPTMTLIPPKEPMPGFTQDEYVPQTMSPPSYRDVAFPNDLYDLNLDYQPMFLGDSWAYTDEIGGPPSLSVGTSPTSTPKPKKKKIPKRTVKDFREEITMIQKKDKPVKSMQEFFTDPKKKEQTKMDKDLAKRILKTFKDEQLPESSSGKKGAGRKKKVASGLLDKVLAKLIPAKSQISKSESYKNLVKQEIKDQIPKGSRMEDLNKSKINEIIKEANVKYKEGVRVQKKTNEPELSKTKSASVKRVSSSAPTQKIGGKSKLAKFAMKKKKSKK